MNIIIIGCGKFGSSLAKSLADEGNNLSIVDRDPDKLDSLGTGFNANRVKGIEFDQDILLEAGIEEADFLIACSSNDNVNITVSLIADKIFHVKRVVARVNELDKLYLYQKLEIEIINPVQYEIDQIRDFLQ